MIAWHGLLAIAAAVAPPPADASVAEDSTGVEQIGRQTSSNREKGEVNQLPAATGKRGAIAQLPPDAEPRADAPQLDAIAPSRPPQKDALYQDVAAAWSAIRANGEQPTPDLIAQRIGPEALARFLANYPGAERMFSIESNALPVAPPGGPPSGGQTGHE